MNAETMLKWGVGVICGWLVIRWIGGLTASLQGTVAPASDYQYGLSSLPSGYVLPYGGPIMQPNWYHQRRRGRRPMPEGRTGAW
jgi:hypothetical protein